MPTPEDGIDAPNGVETTSQREWVIIPGGRTEAEKREAYHVEWREPADGFVTPWQRIRNAVSGVIR